jgi:hypothetical protein
VSDLSPAHPGRLSRRGFLGATGAVVTAATALGAGPAAAAGRPSLADERAVILGIAAAGVVFPVLLPRHDEPGPAGVRPILAQVRRPGAAAPGVELYRGRPVTMNALVAAEQTLAAVRVEHARKGADALIARGLQRTGRAALIAGVADLSATGTAVGRDLLAAVTLAVATVFPGTETGYEVAAREWLTLLGTMHRRGTLRGALAEQGIA